MTITKNKTPITSLDMPTIRDYTVNATITTIDFPQGDHFKHSTLGGFGVRNDFFVEFTTMMRVGKEGKYIFKVSSDDGFRFLVGSTMIGEFVKDRAYQENIYKIALTRGDHQLILEYFQGYGPLGLRAYYQREGDLQWFFIGEDSGSIRFLKQ